MRSRASREELIRRVVSQLLPQGWARPTRYKTSKTTVSLLSGGMTLRVTQGNNSQLFGLPCQYTTFQKLLVS